MLDIFGIGLRVARWPTVVAVLAGLVGAATAVALPVLIGQAIGGAPRVIDSGLTRGSLVLLVALLATLLVANLSETVADAASDVSDGPLQQEVTARIGWAMSRDPGLDRLDDPAVASQVQSIRSRQWDISRGYQILTGVLVRQIPSLVGTSIALGIVLAWWAPLPILVTVLAIAEHMRRSIAGQMDVFAGQVESQKHAAYAFDQGMGRAAKEIRIFGLADFLRARMNDHAMAAHRPYWRRRWRSAGADVVLNLLRAVVSLAVVGYAVREAAAGRVDLTVVATAIPLVMTMARTDLTALGQLQRASTTCARLEELAPAREFAAATRRPRLVARDRPRAAGPGDRDRGEVGQRQHQPSPRIVFDEVSFGYPGTDRLILDGVTLELPAGTATALVGVNGTGKSTLVKLLSAGYLPSRGRILVDDVDLASLEVAQRAAWQRRVAPITQEFLRLPLCAGDNVELGTGHVWAGGLDPDPVPDTSALDAVAERAGCGDLIRRLPSGWATPLDNTMPGGADLSGGEWQRIGLARGLRAVAEGARVLVLDEPAAALDVTSEARLVDGYLDLARSVTSLIISHRFSVVRPVPLIHVMEHGRIVEGGSHEDLMELRAGRYRAMFTLQASRYVEAERES